jgi:hypothetical protein
MLSRMGSPGGGDVGEVARRAAGGALTGALATLPMSAVMLVAQRRGAMGSQPPERVTEEALGRAGVDDASEGSQNVAASVAHLAFGAAGGSAFALMRHALGRQGVDLPGPAAVQGSLFGLAVWALSYQGWIPALGILPPADRDRRDRQRSMVAAHLVYGGALGALEAEAERRCWRSDDAG